MKPIHCIEIEKSSWTLPFVISAWKCFLNYSCDFLAGWYFNMWASMVSIQKAIRSCQPLNADHVSNVEKFIVVYLKNIKVARNVHVWLCSSSFFASLIDLLFFHTNTLFPIMVDVLNWTSKRLAGEYGVLPHEFVHCC